MTEEIEVKFLEIDPEAMVERLKALGAELVYDGRIQDTHFFNSEFSQSDSTMKYLRVRTTPDKTILTYKAPAKDSDAHVRDEMQVEVSDHDMTVSLLKELGYTKRIHSSKRRRHYRLNGCSYEIDENNLVPPLLEIEAPSVEELRGCAELLDLDMGDAVKGLVFELYPDVYGGLEP